MTSIVQCLECKTEFPMPPASKAIRCPNKECGHDGVNFDFHPANGGPCDRCGKPAVAFYTVPIAINGVDGDSDMEDEARCEEHRRDKQPMKGGLHGE